MKNYNWKKEILMIVPRFDIWFEIVPRSFGCISANLWLEIVGVELYQNELVGDDCSGHSENEFTC